MILEGEPLKQMLFRHCNALVEARISTALQAMNSVREAVHDDTKSSAGDKYETTREMMQQEMVRNEQLLLEGRKMQQQLEQAMDARPAKQVGQGSIVETDRGTFFMAIAIGEVRVAGQRYFVISPQSPLGSLMMGKAAGHHFTFRETRYAVLSLY